MSTRTQHSSVVFRRAFRLKGIAGEQPAGTYTLETEEELLEGLSFEAYHRTSTMMTLQPTQPAASIQALLVDPRDVAEALEADGRETPATWQA